MFWDISQCTLCRGDRSYSLVPWGYVMSVFICHNSTQVGSWNLPGLVVWWGLTPSRVWSHSSRQCNTCFQFHPHHQALIRQASNASGTNGLQIPTRGGHCILTAVPPSMAVWGYMVRQRRWYPLKPTGGHCVPLCRQCFKCSFNLWWNLQCWDFLCYSRHRKSQVRLILVLTYNPCGPLECLYEILPLAWM